MSRTRDLVQRWLIEAKTHPEDPAAKLLASTLKDPNGLAFTVAFIDGVMRPESLRVAGRNLARLRPIIPRLLPWTLRLVITIGTFLAPVAPYPVVPFARRTLRSMVKHLVLDARPSQLTSAIATLRASGSRLNLNLLGEAVLGDKEADNRLRGTQEFLARDDVDYVSIKVSAVVSQLSMWSFDEAVDKVTRRLTPLYELAAESGVPKFINLDMEEYRDLDLTIAVFTAILDQPQLRGLRAGIVLQTYLPDALSAMQRLQSWAAARVADGGAPIKVRVVKGANLAMEHVDATMHGWPLATYDRKIDSDTNYKRMLDWAMTPERTQNVDLGVAGHNLFDIAHAWLLAQDRGVTEHVDFEMLLGMATGQAAAVSADVGQLLLYTPVVHPDEFDVAIAYLVRRLEENASSDNFMSAVFDIAQDRGLFEREARRYEDSLAALEQPVAVPTPHRNQDRRVSTGVPGEDGAPTVGARDGGAFTNEPDTDPALAANREWGREILGRVPTSTLGISVADAARIEDIGGIDDAIDAALAAAKGWAGTPGAERGALLRKAAAELAHRRADLIEVAASETGKTIAEGDVEVSEAIDFANYYAHLAADLDQIEGARFIPSALTVVVPPWNFPVAIPAGGVLAALASGSAVVIKPAPQARRCAAVLVDALWAAGIPRDLLVLADLDEGPVARHLIEDPRVDRVVLTGSYETAELFRSWRHDLPLLAETSGKNSIIVTPSADLDLAAGDVVRSAFGHAGQKCSAASLVILVGDAGRSDRFERQLIDATTSMRVGYPADPTTQVGPIIEPAAGKLLRGLTELAPGEKWLVEPDALDETGRLWSPGIRTGVQPGSYFHHTEFFGPVLGIIRAKTLNEAIEIQNGTDYGLTAGLHSLDREEIATWLAGVQAGNLYVNRGITGAIVQRQPFGGWKKSAIGAGTKAGGPNYLFGFGTFEPATGGLDTLAGARYSTGGGDDRVSEAHRDSGARAVSALLTAAAPHLSADDNAALVLATHSDEAEWHARYGVAHDAADLRVERNLLRYVPTPTIIRIGADASVADGLRVIAAGLRAGASLRVSSALELPDAVQSVLAEADIRVRVEAEPQWLGRVAAPLRDTVLAAGRVRLVGEDAGALAAALGGTPTVAIWAHPATACGRIELLPFLREQAVTMTNHRFGNPTDLTDGLL